MAAAALSGFCFSQHAHTISMPVQKTGGSSSSSGNGGGGGTEQNADGSTTYKDPLDAYCDDNPETDECR